MAKIKMDAIEVASSIHKGDFSKLRGKSFEMCDNKNMGNHYTLNQLGNKVNQLETTVDKLAMTINDLAIEMRAGFKQVNNRIDNLEKRIDKIDTRLDYIVDANNLKDNK